MSSGFIVFTFLERLIAQGHGQRGFNLQVRWVGPAQPGNLVIQIGRDKRPKTGCSILLGGVFFLVVGLFREGPGLGKGTNLAQQVADAQKSFEIPFLGRQ